MSKGLAVRSPWTCAQSEELGGVDRRHYEREQSRLENPDYGLLRLLDWGQKKSMSFSSLFVFLVA
jgi:hypothetical protein